MVEKKDTKKSTEKIEEAKKVEKKNLKEEGKKIFTKLGLDINVRAEKLTLQNFADITNMICGK